MRGLVVALALLAVAAGACGGKASSADESTVAGALPGGAGEVAGGATGGGGARASGGMSATGGVSATATGGRPSSGEWSDACHGAADTLRLQRLTASDLERTLEEVFGGPGARLGSNWPELRQGGQGRASLAEATQLLGVAQERAKEYAATAIECVVENQDCLPRFAELGLRLFRRPLADSELESFRALYDQQREELGNGGGVEAVVQAMILSPHFTFRVETSSAGRFSDYTVATRLAYFLWRSGPDAHLLDAAAAGELSADRSSLARHVERLLDDARAQYGFAAVVKEWLELARFGRPNASAWPAGVPIAEMAEQTELFLERSYAGGRATLAQLLLASGAPFVAPLAEYYGLPSDELGPGFDELELDRAQFSGILTHGSLLLTARSPSTRGSLLLRRLVCRELGAPPVDEMLPTVGNTRRERYEAISDSGGCRPCHEHLDPLGFALEGFDSLGAPQASPVNGSVLGLDGVTSQTFDGPRGLAELLAESPQVSRCVARHFGEYALDGGQGKLVLLQSGAPEPPPREPPLPPPPLDCLAAAFDGQRGDLRSLLAGLAQSDVFLRANTDFELPVFRASERSPLEHAAGTADALARAAATVVENPLEIQSYAEALATLAREEAP